jgi:hypothetical protein
VLTQFGFRQAPEILASTWTIAILATLAVLATITLAAHASGIGRLACALVSHVLNVAANTASSSGFGFVVDRPRPFADSVPGEDIEDRKYREACKHERRGFLHDFKIQTTCRD